MTTTATLNDYYAAPDAWMTDCLAALRSGACDDRGVERAADRLAELCLEDDDSADGIAECEGAERDLRAVWERWSK
jgi:hypothetical protein